MTTMHRISSHGFEAQFVNSYTGWDLHDTLVIGFYDCEIKDVFGLDTSKFYDVTFMFDQNLVQVIESGIEQPAEGDEHVFTLNMSVTAR
jgi:hypothetical protein